MPPRLAPTRIGDLADELLLRVFCDVRAEGFALARVRRRWRELVASPESPLWDKVVVTVSGTRGGGACSGLPSTATRCGTRCSS